MNLTFNYYKSISSLHFHKFYSRYLPFLETQKKMEQNWFHEEKLNYKSVDSAAVAVFSEWKLWQTFLLTGVPVMKGSPVG